MILRKCKIKHSINFIAIYCIDLIYIIILITSAFSIPPPPHVISPIYKLQQTQAITTSIIQPNDQPVWPRGGQWYSCGSVHIPCAASPAGARPHAAGRLPPPAAPHTLHTPACLWCAQGQSHVQSLASKITMAAPQNTTCHTWWCLYCCCCLLMELVSNTAALLSGGVWYWKKWSHTLWLWVWHCMSGEPKAYKSEWSAKESTPYPVANGQACFHFLKNAEWFSFSPPNVWNLEPR